MLINVVLKIFKKKKDKYKYKLMEKNIKKILSKTNKKNIKTFK